jgi:phosphoribosylaminoimidazolecarboxamide formyltransferase/IMP cyclohydrolase
MVEFWFRIMMHFSDDIKVVTETQPTEEQKKALIILSESGKICKI